ncbi:predicted protein [Sclerotinia sclerotiorum 1980 UF-70]|uniref:Uncharacterized protein n=2 Tax=Sclerotinia sclerotiorum (strain ATCC 18683 / 1980 / Ss-1) TaxID=665079 RepID=A7EIU8_SCLS1|nr:predicted protein [Sclerotinia sclerotiorum 1980 UF-70]APA11752.1 hypothetical protein sscle_08g065220 [Sclerotinia sclerotiorum 1980 UF-70]EDO02764.1 predicted protein [Sclerotinia sclerotiorum 1980 UF-70]
MPLCDDHTGAKTKIVHGNCPYHQRWIDTSSPGQKASDSTRQDDGVPISIVHDSFALPMQPSEPGKLSSRSYQPPRSDINVFYETQRPSPQWHHHLSTSYQPAQGRSYQYHRLVVNQLAHRYSH